MPMPIAYGDMPKILMFGYNSPTKQPYLAQFPVDIKLEPSQSYFCDGPFLIAEHVPALGIEKVALSDDLLLNCLQQFVLRTR